MDNSYFKMGSDPARSKKRLPKGGIAQFSIQWHTWDEEQSKSAIWKWSYDHYDLQLWSQETQGSTSPGLHSLSCTDRFGRKDASGATAQPLLTDCSMAPFLKPCPTVLGAPGSAPSVFPRGDLLFCCTLAFAERTQLIQKKSHFD